MNACYYASVCTTSYHLTEKTFLYSVKFLYYGICMSYAVGAGVGGIEAEAVMLGQCISMVLPQVRSCAVC